MQFGAGRGGRGGGSFQENAGDPRSSQGKETGPQRTKKGRPLQLAFRLLAFQGAVSLSSLFNVISLMSGQPQPRLKNMLITKTQCGILRRLSLSGGISSLRRRGWNDL